MPASICRLTRASPAGQGPWLRPTPASAGAEPQFATTESQTMGGVRVAVVRECRIRYRLAIVKRPKGWRPRRWDDSPPAARISGTIRLAGSARRRAIGARVQSFDPRNLGVPHGGTVQPHPPPVGTAKRPVARLPFRLNERVPGGLAASKSSARAVCRNPRTARSACLLQCADAWAIYPVFLNGCCLRLAIFGSIAASRSTNSSTWN